MSTYNSLSKTNYTQMNGEYEISPIVQSGGASGALAYTASGSPADLPQVAATVGTQTISVAYAAAKSTVNTVGVTAEEQAKASADFLIVVAQNLDDANMEQIRTVSPQELYKIYKSASKDIRGAGVSAPKFTAWAPTIQPNPTSPGDLETKDAPRYHDWGTYDSTSGSWVPSVFNNAIKSFITGINTAAVGQTVATGWYNNLKIIAEYIAHNVNSAGENIPPSPSSEKYSFLPMADVDTGYLDHSQTDPTILDNLAVPSMQVAAFNPMMMGMPMGMAMGIRAGPGEGVPKQSGGGAVVISHAPTRKAYCSDSNFLAKELDRIKDLMKDGGKLKLSANSLNNLDILKKRIEDVEKESCATLDLLDDLYFSTNEDGTNAQLPGINMKHPDGLKLEALIARKDDLAKEARKLKSRMFSSIVTLSDMMKDGARDALKEAAKAGELGAAAAAAALATTVPTTSGSYTGASTTAINFARLVAPPAPITSLFAL